MKPILAAAAILSVAFGMTAQATPINYSFSVTATTGSLSGTTAAGTFHLERNHLRSDDCEHRPAFL